MFVSRVGIRSSVASKLAAALVVSVLFVARPIAAQTPDDGPTEVRMGRYIAGGVVGTVVGFGVGHGVQGRWLEDGWIFTVGETVSLAAYVAGIAMLAADMSANLDADADADAASGSGGAGLALASGIALFGFHIWEIVDVWAGAQPYKKSRYASGSQDHVRLSLVPVPLADGAALSFALQY